MCSAKSLFFEKKKLNYTTRFDFYPFLYFSYHRLFFGSLVHRGRKLWAFNFLQRLKYELKKQEDCEAFLVLLVAWLQITPDLILFPRKLGGSVKQVPLPITERKQYTFAIKWVIKLLRDKHKNRTLTLSAVVDLLIDAIYDKGLAVEKKISIYKNGFANIHLMKYFK